MQQTSAYELISELINQALTDGDIIPAEQAQQITNTMREDHPAEHQQFLEAEAPNLYHTLLRNRIHSQRARARHARDPTQFNQQATAGDLNRFQLWRCCVDPQNTQRAIGDMTGKDHLYVADNYHTSAEKAKFLAEFHRAIARKIGSRKTSDVYTETQFFNLYQRITGNQPA
jgi:hypothetical protein